VAKHVVQQKDANIGQAMDYLRRSGDLVKIEDVLPFFPDFVTIETFKEAICESLQQYSDHIEELRREMEESNRSADAIRADIQSYRDHYVFVRASDRCSACPARLMTAPFHLFPCGHRVHTTCLLEEIAPHLSAARRGKLNQLRAELAAAEREDVAIADKDALRSGAYGGGGSVNGSAAAALPSKAEALRNELDSLVAAECCFCGDAIVRMVDKPLIEEEDFEETLREWL